MSLLFYFIFAAIGAVLGSFIGVLAERIHTGQKWVNDRSRCNSCAVTLRGHELIPIVSWLAALGRCRLCKAKIPFSYLLLEVVLAVLFVLSYQVIGLGMPLIVFLGALSVLAFIVVYDLRHTIVPPLSSLLLFVLAVVFVVLRMPDATLLGEAFFTAGVIGLAFLALYAFSRGKAMGLGDAPVALSLSLLSAPYAFSGLLFSFWIGALCGILILVFRQGGPKMGIEVPFVPFMAVGFLLAYFTGWTPFSLFLP